jgi:hypothetical protein
MMHLVGFTIGIYYGARTYEPQMLHVSSANMCSKKLCFDWRLNADLTFSVLVNVLNDISP